MTTHTANVDDSKSSGWRAYCTATAAERIARAVAGVVILTGLGLGYFVNPWFFLLPAFAGVNLLQSSVTGFCPPEMVFNLLRWRRSA